MPPASRVDSFKVSYQLADGGDAFLPMSSSVLSSPLPLHSSHPQLLWSSLGNLLALNMFSGEPQSVQVDGRAQTQKLQGLIPGARYEVTVVSVRGFEESEPLTGFLTTGERDWARSGGREMRVWAGAWKDPKGKGGEALELCGLASGQRSGRRLGVGRAVQPPLSPSPLPVPDGPTELRALNLTEGSTLLHWKPPQNPVDTYNVKVTAPGGELC